MSVETSKAPSCRKCRGAGEKLFLKGAKCRTSKCPEEVRKSAPGQHGKAATTKKLSQYGNQLQEKQKVKRMYGLFERQFKRFFELAVKQKGIKSENLLILLERRLDNTIFRLKMALSRSQARQMIVHGHVNINGHRVSSPSYLVKAGDQISLSSRTLTRDEFVKNVIDKRMSMGIKVPEWLELNKAERKGVVTRLPVRADVTAPIQEHLIVELYSK